MATLDFDSDKQGGALAGGGVEGDTENLVMTITDSIEHFGNPVKGLRSDGNPTQTGRITMIATTSRSAMNSGREPARAWPAADRPQELVHGR